MKVEGGQAWPSQQCLHPPTKRIFTGIYDINIFNCATPGNYFVLLQNIPQSRPRTDSGGEYSSSNLCAFLFPTTTVHVHRTINV